MRRLAAFSFSFSAACLIFMLFSGRLSHTALLLFALPAAALILLVRNSRIRIISAGFAFGLVWCVFYEACLAGLAGSLRGSLPQISFSQSAVPAAIDRLFDAQSAAFLKALLTGDRTDFFHDAALSTAFRRSGISHVVAVSGLHVAFLVGMVQSLAGRSRHSAFACIMLVWFFVFMSGASPSALRAAVMQTVLLLAPVLKRENDTITSLSFALLLLLIADPSSILSASLQLSFAAVLGISLFARRLEEALQKTLGRFAKNRLMQYLTGTVAASVSVMIFTVPLTALHFGSVQLLSPLTNILVLWCVSFCMIGGILCVLLSFVAIPVAAVLARAVALAVRYIVWCAKAISAWRFSAVYVCSDYAVWWVIGVYLVFLAFSRVSPFGRRIRPAARGLIPLVISVASLFVLSFGTKAFYAAQPGYFTAVSVGQGQCISVLAGDATVVVDCGSTFTAENAGDKAGEYLLSRGRERVNVLVLTHLHEDHVNGVLTLMEYLPVDQILISAYVPDEEGILPELKASAAAHQSKLVLLKESAQVQCGDISLDLTTPHTGKEENESCMFVQATIRDTALLITGDAPAATEKEYITAHGVSGIDVLIAGHHGSKNSTCDELIARCLDAKCIVSTGKNPYGHPAQEALERLSVLPAVYRTDVDGTVQIAVR